MSVDTLKRVAEAQPQNALVHELLANFLMGSDTRAAEQSARAAPATPNAAASHSLLGEALLAQQRFQGVGAIVPAPPRLRPTTRCR